ncbi:MAG: D-aminoacyl-tRNA deacylase [Chlorobi bacterium]|nr:D-aminoacyl-tRNA deacylase [Chlorobiota bacterium]MCI0716683.1 D-aminoacyl-tRNA deacylase [Chlorobiota bacterium]
MIALVQRVLESSVAVDSQMVDMINRGLLVLLGVRNDDSENDAKYLAAKTVNLRIFSDENDKMNLSLLDTGFEILVVSQFTLHADTRHGNRPSFTDAAEPEKANELYSSYILELKNLIGHDKVREGKFGVMMKVKLVNDGPVTIILKSKNDY